MTQQTITAADAIRRIQDSGREAAAHERVTEIIDAVLKPGLHVRQGDIILRCLETTDAKPKGKPVSDRQLAPGNTQGSRHICEGDALLFAPTTSSPLDGPEIRVGERGCTITHPEHRHYKLPAGSRWGVVYERDLAAEEVSRVAD